MTNHDVRLVEAAKLRTLVPQSELEAVLKREIADRCHRKVAKRLALRLALAVISDDRDGMFIAEKLVDELRPRIKHEAALREIYIERDGA